MSNLLLDSTVVIDLARNHTPTMRWIATQQMDDLYISTITVGELHRGAYHRHLRDAPRLAEAVDVIRQRILRSFGGRVINFDAVAAEIWGRLMGEGAARGRLPPIDDAKIAAIAMQHQMVVATSNEAHFLPLVACVNPRTA